MATSECEYSVEKVSIERATDYDSDGNDCPVLLVLVGGRYIVQVSDNEAGRRHIRETFGVEVQ